MHVLMMSQVFRPEMGAGARRMDSIMKHLVRQGHKVSVATGMPNYPTGIIHPDYRGTKFMIEEMDGAKVYRTYYYTPPRNQSTLSQGLSYLAMMPASFYSGIRAAKPDLIFVSPPPIFSALPAVWLKKVTGAKLMVDLRDLWPDEPVACAGMKEESAPVRIMRMIEKSAYRNADCVSCTTRAFQETVISRGVKPENTVFAPNGADVDFFRPVPADNPVAAEYNFGDKFVAMYSGVIGIKHNLDTVIDAAKLLMNEKDIVIFVRGAGPKRGAIEERVKKEGVSNVVFGEERPFEDVPYLISRANVCLTGLLPDIYLDKIISVKIFEYMACERPVVAALSGESARVISDANAGTIVPAGDAKAMADAILHLYRNPELCTQMGKRGRQHIIENYTREVTAVRLEQRMLELVGSAKIGQQEVDDSFELLPDPATK